MIGVDTRIDNRDIDAGACRSHLVRNVGIDSVDSPRKRLLDEVSTSVPFDVADIVPLGEFADCSVGEPTSHSLTDRTEVEDVYHLGGPVLCVRNCGS